MRSSAATNQSGAIDCLTFLFLATPVFLVFTLPVSATSSESVSEEGLITDDEVWFWGWLVIAVWGWLVDGWGWGWLVIAVWGWLVDGCGWGWLVIAVWGWLVEAVDGGGRKRHFWFTARNDTDDADPPQTSSIFWKKSQIFPPLPLFLSPLLSSIFLYLKLNTDT
jgi:hypothetical protein